MSLLADSSPRLTRLGKQLSENGGFDSYNFPSNFKRPKLDAFRSFPVNCFAAPAHGAAPSDIRDAKPNVDFSEEKRINGRKSEWSGNAKKVRCSGGKKYGAVIPAVPLRSLPSTSVEWNPEKSVTLHDKDDAVARISVSNGKNTVRQQEELWDHDSEKLETILAEAKEFINLLDVKYSASLNSRKRKKVEDRIPDVGQDEKAFGMGTEGKDNEEEVSVLSAAEWNVLQSCFNQKGDAAKASMGKIEEKLQKWSSHESSGKCQNVVESKGTKIVDSVGMCSVGTKSDQESEGIPDCEPTEPKCAEENQGYSFMDLDEFSSEGEQDESLEKFSVDDNAIVVYSDISINAAVNCHSEPKYCENKELINLQIVQHEHPEGCKVLRTLKLFEEQYVKLSRERELDLREGKSPKYPHFEAAKRLKEMGMFIPREKPFGHIPGIEIGDEFRFRAELAVVGLHCQLISGIDYVVLDRKKYATSVVDSGRYENEAKSPDVLIYSGQGGNPKLVDNAADQKLEKGNLALKNSMEMGYPVRVTYKRKAPMVSKTLGMSNEGNVVYVYDGLYMVKRCRQERDDQSGKLVFKFEMHRLPDQPRSCEMNAKSGELTKCMEACVLDDVSQGKQKLPVRETNAKSGKSIKCLGVCVLGDVSQGKEKLPVRVVNEIDDDLPLPFTYITNIVYPYWFQHIEPVGCNCINGCSDSQPCPCILKNGGEIPFNEDGAILIAKPRVYECGPSCKCPSSCMNRVSQHGPHYQLEIFKTESRGWGVRSRDYISPGGFICEYVGELLQEKEAEQRIGNDEYLFDLKRDGFTVDAAVCGNIGRFINHSCSPNLYAQEVLYDHGDKRMPHIMFFAADDIPPLRELTYDYNYRMNRVRDANGNIKKKDCYCGSQECTGRMY